MDNNKNKKEKTVKQIVGELGEHFAAKHLVSRHFVIKEKNYRKKWGELDIIAEKDGVLRFMEVKSLVTKGYVSRVTSLGSLLWHVSCETSGDNVTRETPLRPAYAETSTSGIGAGGATPEKQSYAWQTLDYFPEENIHLWKQRRMARAIKTYLLEKHVPEDQEWQIDVIAVFLDFSKKYATIRHLDDVVFDIDVA